MVGQKPQQAEVAQAAATRAVMSCAAVGWALIAAVGCGPATQPAGETPVPIHKAWVAQRMVRDKKTGQMRPAFKAPLSWVAVARSTKDLPAGFPLKGVDLSKYMLVLSRAGSLSGDVWFKFERVTRTAKEIRVYAREHSGHLTNAMIDPISVVAIPRHDLPVRIIVRNAWKDRPEVVTVLPDGAHIRGGLHVTLESDRSAFKVGESVVVHFGLRNRAAKPIQVPTNVPGGTEYLYFASVVLTDRNDRSFQGNRYYHFAFRISGPARTMTLQPGVLGLGVSVSLSLDGRPIPKGTYRVTGAYAGIRTNNLTITVEEQSEPGSASSKKGTEH